ncbi:RNA polymerase sigma-70 factor, sigma-E family [Amycolatopsis xylanica]|uniref:RNA polymerase sigma-70 factor, sigma-E family n=1 Tax=Amycolatopsis xylanica TaxID=589385 RepID=A0A1H2U7H9_9PSEU|nr:sigma-70 family RNA polymerase sigma factor [Amycolatopsis xylanica]SDW52106.1 RNA polymerase sigma-70 factor, sigma-E family [Amycolatopsis xylanica]
MSESAREADRPAAVEDAEFSFEMLFHQRFETMKRLAYLLGADDAENIAQEAFARLHQRWARLDDPAEKAAAYLRTTVINLSRSRLRHLRVVRRSPREVLFDEESAESHAFARSRHRHLREALRSLARRQREVLVLRYWMDLDQATIAETLGIAVGTVKATTSQALGKLRERLERETGEW